MACRTFENSTEHRPKATSAAHPWVDAVAPLTEDDRACRRRQERTPQQRDCYECPRKQSRVHPLRAREAHHRNHRHDRTKGHDRRGGSAGSADLTFHTPHNGRVCTNPPHIQGVTPVIFSKPLSCKGFTECAVSRVRRTRQGKPGRAVSALVLAELRRCAVDATDLGTCVTQGLDRW